MTLSEARKLEWENTEIRNKRISAMRGKKRSKKTKEKISRSHKGMKKPWAGKYKRSKEEIKRISLMNIGRKPWNTGKHRYHMMGEKHWNWRGGITPETLKISQSLEYKLWRKMVFERDNYTCVLCGDNKGGNLQADHIKPKAVFPELIFDIDNGRTLCKKCHKETDTWGWKTLNYILGRKSPSKLLYV